MGKEQGECGRFTTDRQVLEKETDITDGRRTLPLASHTLALFIRYPFLSSVIRCESGPHQGPGPSVENLVTPVAMSVQSRVQAL